MRLIDADDLKEKLKHTSRDVVMDYGEGFVVSGYSEQLVCLLISEAPTINAAPVVHGRWKSGQVLEKCSVCGKKGFPEWRYCPSCGAKMDGGDNK